MNMNNREIHTVLYNNNKNHRERRNYQDRRVCPVYGIFKSQREGENEVYGTLRLHYNMKRRHAKRSIKKLGWNCEISNDRNLLKAKTSLFIKNCKVWILQKVFSSELTSFFPLPPSHLSEESAANTTKQTNFRTITLAISSFPPTATYSCNAFPVFLCQSVTLQESKPLRWERPEWYIPAMVAYWLTWGLRAW